jgi:hypothetical protein
MLLNINVLHSSWKKAKNIGLLLADSIGFPTFAVLIFDVCPEYAR